MRRLQLGEAEAVHLPGGDFRLDGGTMFGVVPKALWQRECPPDVHNRIRLSCNCLLLKTGGELVLLDAGFGERFSSRERAMYGHGRRAYIARLARGRRRGPRGNYHGRAHPPALRPLLRLFSSQGLRA